MQDSSLEKQMQQLMSGLEFEPDAAVWENVEREIHKERKKRIAAWWWLTGLLLLCLSGGIVWYSTGKKQAARPVAMADTNNSAGVTRAPQKQTLSPVTAEKSEMTAADDAHITTGVGVASVPEQEFVTGYGNKRRVKRTMHTNASMQQAQVLMTPADYLQNNQYGESVMDDTAGDIVSVSPLSLPDATIISGAINSSLDETAAGSGYPDPFTPATLAPPPVISRKHPWRIYPLAGAGVAANIGGVNTTYSYNSSYNSSYYSLVAEPDKSALDNVSSNPNTGTGGGQTTYYNFKNQRFTHPKLAFRAGFELEKYIAPRWRLLTGLQYQYLSYNSVITTSISGIFSSTGGPSTNQFVYKLHYAAVPLLLQYRVSRPIGISAGIFNNLAITGRQNGAVIKQSMRAYIPSASLMLDVLLQGRNQQVWKISPYMQYGFNSSFGATLLDKKMLQGGIQAVFQINKK